MNKKEMADRLAARTGLSKSAARNAVDSVFVTVGEALAHGEDVWLPGFGTFGTRSRPARNGRNPRTGKAVSISASTSPTFKAGKTLKNTVNGGSGIVTVRRAKTATGSAVHRRHVESGRFLYDDGHSASCQAVIGQTQGFCEVGSYAAAPTHGVSRMRQEDNGRVAN